MNDSTLVQVIDKAEEKQVDQGVEDMETSPSYHHYYHHGGYGYHDHGYGYGGYHGGYHHGYHDHGYHHHGGYGKIIIGQ